MFEYAHKLKNRFSVKLFLCLAFTISFNFACQPSPSMLENASVPPPSEASQNDGSLTSLEREIRDMKNVDFQFIYVFKRRDGGAFDAEDKQFIRANRPAEINRFSATDDGRAFVAGSNFNFPPENLENLRKRFVVEDLSKPIAVVEQSANNSINNNANQMPKR